MTQFIWPTTPVQLYCSKKWFETTDTISLQLVSEHQESFDFKPGQFISVGIEIEGKMEYRAYSISSIPSQDFLQLTIKRVEGGKVSNYLIDQLNEGDEVAVLAATGPFNSVDCQPRKKVVLLSAGCGITPVMSMAKSWITQDIEIDITFIHVAKNKEQTIFFEELELLNNIHANFHLKLLLKDNTGTNHSQGRLDQEWLNTLCPDLADRTVYLCGPNLFMQDMKSNVENLGLDMTHFFQESFTPFEAQITETTESSGVVQFEVPAFGIAKKVDKGANLADLLEENGVPIIIACRSGMCGSCKCKVVKGVVNRTSTETLSQEDIEAGYTLACSTQIQSDVEMSLA